MPHVLAGHANSFHTYSFDQALGGIAEAGYAHVELSAIEGWTPHVDLDASPAAIRSALAAYGLTATVLSAHSDLTTPEGVAHAIKAVRWCAAYGIPVMNTAIGGHAGQTESEPAFLAHIGAIADAAASEGVDVALEIHGDIMSSGAQALPLLQRIAHPRIKVAYDTANCEFYAGVTAAADLPAVLPYLVNVHVKDKRGGMGEWDFPAAGDGHVDFRAVLAALDAGGYTGPLSVEIEFQGEPWPPLAAVIDAMRRARVHLNGLGVT